MKANFSPSTAFFALLLSTSFAVADGCGKAHKDTAMQFSQAKFGMTS